jgi:hypothetical protein
MAGIPDGSTDNESLEDLDDIADIEGFDHDNLDDIELTPGPSRKSIEDDDDTSDDDESDAENSGEPNAGNKVVGYDPSKDQRRKPI